MSAKINRQKLAALLEEYGSSISSFDALRSDSYEQALAAVSLESLEQFYSEIFTPGQSAAAAQKKCPPWPPGTKHEGEFPSVGIICKTCERFNTESTLNGLGPVQAFLEQFRKSVQATPMGNNREMTDAVIALAGQELIKAKQSGIPVSAQLKTVTALQNQVVIEQNDQKLQQSRDKILLQRERNALITCRMFLKWYGETKAREIADSNLSNADKITALRQTYFADVEELEKSGEVKLPE